MLLRDPADTRLSRFIASWDSRDRYLRFGSNSPASLALLEDALRDRDHHAIVAVRHSDIVALLDYAAAADGLEPGIVVAPAYRRRGVGRRLMRRFLERAGNRPVVAESRLENRPANLLLSSCGFNVIRRDGGELRWSWTPAALPSAPTTAAKRAL